MKKLLQLLGTVVLIALVYFVVEQYTLRETAATLKEIPIVTPAKLNKLSIVTYPEMDTYQSFDVQEVLNTYRTINALPMKETNKLDVSEHYVKIRFTEDGGNQYTVYSLYDNGYISIEEDNIVMYRNTYYKVDVAELKSFIEQLVANKQWD